MIARSHCLFERFLAAHRHNGIDDLLVFLFFICQELLASEVTRNRSDCHHNNNEQENEFSSKLHQAGFSINWNTGQSTVLPQYKFNAKATFSDKAMILRIIFHSQPTTDGDGDKSRGILPRAGTPASK